MPPNGRLDPTFFLRAEPIAASLSKRMPSTMETERSKVSFLPPRQRRAALAALTLIDDEHLDALPLATRHTILLDLADEELDRIVAEPDAGERVDRRSANVASGHSSGGSDGHSVGGSLVLALEGGDDLTKEDRLARSYTSIAEEGQLGFLAISAFEAHQRIP